MTFNPKSDITDNEILYRVVRPFNLFWKKKFNKLSTAAFKDRNGLSVDRDGERSENAVIDDFNRRRFEGALISAIAGDCKAINTYLVPKPNNWKYHAEILDSRSKIILSNEKCEKLVGLFKVVCTDISK